MKDMKTLANNVFWAVLNGDIASKVTETNNRQ